MAGPPIIEAADWRQQSWRPLPDMTTPAANTWGHHGGVGAVATPTLPVLRGYERHHVVTLGWRAIGYSFAYGRPFVTDELGITWATIYTCRGWGKAGGHTFGHNTTSHGHLFIGGWSTDVPPEPMVNSLAWNIQRGAEVGACRLELTGGHRDAARQVGRSTVCPGDGGMTALARARQLLETNLIETLRTDQANDGQEDNLMRLLPTLRRRGRSSRPPLAQPYDPDGRVQGLCAADGTLELAPNIVRLPDGRITFDKKFGGRTEGSVKESQRRAGLPMTGVVDERTWRALLGVS